MEHIYIRHKPIHCYERDSGVCRERKIEYESMQIHAYTLVNINIVMDKRCHYFFGQSWTRGVIIFL